MRNLSYVITGIDGNREVFVNFYKTRGVSSEARLTRSEEARAQTDNTPSTGKVTQNSPTDQTNSQQSATEQGTDRYSHNNKDKKNTAFTGSAGQSGSDASSGGLVRSALNIPTDTQGVPFDSAKVRKNAQSTKHKELEES